MFLISKNYYIAQVYQLNLNWKSDKRWTHIWNLTISVIDLAFIIKETKIEDLSTKFIVITEYNGSTEKFLVGSDIGILILIEKIFYL